MNGRDSHEQLVQAPWHFLSFSGYRFAVKYICNPNEYEILITDLVSMWREKLLAEEVMTRNSKINPDIETSQKIILTHIEQLITKEDCTKIMTVDSCNEDELKIKSQSSLSTLIFNWEFHLSSVSRSMFSEHLTKPFMATVAEFSQCYRQLVQILKNKDAQIEDYKAEGVVLQRRYKDDQPFNETQFMNNLINSEEFMNMVHQPEEAAFNSDVQKMYAEIVKVKCQPKPDVNAATVNTKISTEKERTNADSITPPSSSDCAMNEKDKEIDRRKILEQKLSDEKQKKERKAKKLKL